MKLFRYFEFVLESNTDVKLPTLFSKDFIKRIESIDSPISKDFELITTYGSPQYKLLSKWTFVSVSESDDKIVFTDSAKVKKYISEIYGIEEDDEIIDFVKKLTFPSPDNQLIHFARTEMNIGRFVRAFFVEKYTDFQIEKFVNQWKSFSGRSTFEIWEKSEIGKGYSSRLYHFNDYDSGMNPLMNSCMNDLPYVAFYQYCPSVKLLVLLDEEGAILGRALLWTDLEGRNIMDRVYFVYDKDYYKFIRWANENDYFYKKMNTGLTKFIKQGKEETILTGVKILDAFAFPEDEYPYMDTFSYVHGDIAYNYEPKGTYWRFMNTDGTYDVYDYD